MKRFNIKNINSEKYWDKHQTALDFGLRQQKYLDLAGTGYSITEVGCGLSPFLSRALDNFTFAIGYDFSPETIKRAKKLYPEVVYLKADVTKFNTHNKFSVVVAGEIIEHLEDPDAFIKKICSMATKRVILSTPILEFKDKEHLWEFDEEYFISKGFKTEVVKSDRFKGRSYIFAWKDK